MNPNRGFLTAVLAFALGGPAMAHSHGIDNRIRGAADRVQPTAHLAGDVPEERGATSKAQVEFVPRVDIGGGYSSNPALTPGGAGSYFASAKLALEAFRFDPSSRSQLSAAYIAAGSSFEGEARQNNELVQSARVDWRHAPMEVLHYSTSASFTSVGIGSKTIINVVEFSADARVALTSHLSSGLLVAHQRRDARVSHGGRREPDATRLLPVAYASVDLAGLTQRDGLPVLSFGFSPYANLARGADEDFSAQRFLLAATNWRPGADLFVHLEAAYEERSGANASSQLGGLARRNDRVVRASAVVNHPLLFIRRHAVSLSAGYEESRSNLAGANYEALQVAATWGFAF
jgi:hypothetical protein